MFAKLFARAPEGSRRHRLGLWWRQYAGSVAFITVVALFAAGLWYVQNEAHKRERQFCQLIDARYNEHYRQYDQTIKFLAANPSSNDPILTFVRANLDKQKEDLQVEANGVPEFCVQYAGDDDPAAALPDVPVLDGPTS